MPLRYTGERAIPWNPGVGQHVMVPHIMRYAWACQFVWQKRVVDLGCGTGYGSFILSMVAREVTGVELDLSTLYFAEERFRADNLNFAQNDLRTGPVPPGDVYVAFEVLEHLDNPDQLVQSLSAPLVWSIPVQNKSAFHKQVYSLDDIHSMMGSIDWYQNHAGAIMPSTVAPNWFDVAYALGVHVP